MRRTIIAFLILSLAACKGERAERVPGAPATSVPDIALNGSSVDITAGGKKLHGETRDSGKRKYNVDGGAVAYEVKSGDDDGFKLRTPDGELLWKVKIAAEKIKISDNNENDQPFELKAREGNRTKVFAPGDREVGNVRFDGSRIQVEDSIGKTLFTIPATKPSAAYGVLLLDGIPEPERAILMAEILSRGR
ncbi:MAG TPA: hypothetical protein VND45_01500 [Thermoanaerobaculia bacterium]|jgi:hypothetical protein|nr:hypothetical protein [Thermoanaerobaculia bacterium]